ncbi:class I SAM-dependent methyltransferase [Gorillibacterium sp. sgz5001074]|uniref:class I SAM-dependent methyltransferase n=1 Tax=Gorillibacterium sp. sgz5001074 TaxID=3446695 RepID=UPI003F675C50
MGFYETLSRYYDELFPASAPQVRFVAGRVPAGGAILDVAAGTGNLALELAKLGYRVTAIDVDPAMTERMEVKAAEAGGEGFRPLQMDMRGLNTLPAQAYDAVLCVGNSLVHLDNLIEIADAVIRMYDRLKPGGTLVLQVVNYDRILRDHVKELPLIERQAGEDRVVFRRTYEMGEDGILFLGHLTVEGREARETYESEVRLLPLQSEELLQIMDQFGLPVPELYGSFQGEPYAPDSPAIVAVLRKPED